MEDDYCISAPCLLDDLMDSNIVKCDVELGMTVDPVFASKSSPSHESDSGCSDMSEVRSVSPISDVDFLSPNSDDRVELFDFESVASIESTVDEFDTELESYLATPVESQNRTVLKMPDSVVHDGRSITLVESGSPVIEVDSDGSDPDYVPERRVIQSKALVCCTKVHTVQEEKPRATIIKLPFSTKRWSTDIHILPSSSKGNNSDICCKSKSSTPTVKVVKVVKTAAQSKHEIDQELLEALDDRNKKNAVQAKINREKKKVYMKTLEDEIEDLKCENFTLKESSRKAIDEKNELLEEVEYLRSVLANQSVLSGLLKNIGNVENVKLSSSTRKRSADLDHDYHNAPKHARSSAKKTAGICLHVDQGNLSLEFCSKCASMAKSDGKKGDS